MLMKVSDVRCILLVLLARLRIVLFLLALSLPLHADRNGNAANRNKRHRHREDRNERNLTAAQIVVATPNQLLIARRRRLVQSIERLITIDALEAVGALTFKAIDTIKARRAVFAWR